MTNKKKRQPGVNEKNPQALPKTPAQVKKWIELQKEMDDKLKELIYEDRNGYRPPKPWYED